MIRLPAFTARGPRFTLGVALVVLYVVVYGALLWVTDGLPYVMDNNETFSSLWHAANIARFGVGESFGLTDESYGITAAAHPFVYTHQGNVPRVFALLLYALGAHTAESQIVVTTFTVGLASMLMAYAFLCRLSTPLFAFIACALLASDYLFVMQWHVVTYRVWHMFFFFSGLLCVQNIGAGAARWKVLLAITFTALYYFEFYFVAFLSLTCAIYATFLYRRQLRSLFWTWGLQALGAVIGLTVLGSQLVAYMGWENFLRDGYFTFVARNQFKNDPQLLARMLEFFETNHIVFWINLEDGAKLRNLAYFVASFTYYELQWRSPLFNAVCGIVLLTAGFLVLRPRAEGRRPPGQVLAQLLSVWGSRPVLVVVALLAVHVAHKLIRNDFRAQQWLAVVAVVFACLVVAPLALLFVAKTRRWLPDAIVRYDLPSRLSALTIAACTCPALIAHRSSDPAIFDRFSGYFLSYLALFAVALVVIVAPWQLISKRGTVAVSSAGVVVVWAARLVLAGALFVAVLAALASHTVCSAPRDFGLCDLSRPSAYVVAAIIALATVGGLVMAGRARAGRLDTSAPTVVLRAAAFLLVITASLVFHTLLYDENYRAVWLRLQAEVLAAPLQYAMLILALIVGIWTLLRTPTGGADGFAWLGAERHRVWQFIVSGFVAYVIAYWLSPGYAFSGYRARMLSVTIYFTILPMAFVLCWLYRQAQCGLRGDSGLLQRSGSSGRSPVFGVAAMVLLGLCTWFWVGTQFFYARMLPPDAFAFLRKLSAPPYRNASFVVNTYAAPVAAATGSWAYLHAGASAGRLPMVDGKPVMALDKTYLWMADKDSNPAYARPMYYLCVTPPSMLLMQEEVLRQAGAGQGPRGCRQDILVAASMQSNGRSGDAGAGAGPRMTLAEIDTDGPKRVGYERWAIVKLDW